MLRALAALAIFAAGCVVGFVVAVLVAMVAAGKSLEQ